MKLFTFKKGIHPPYGKSLTENSKIESYLPKNTLVFPMSQHIGSPCKPIVNVGDSVLVGQKIGESTGFVSSNIYSSVSGTVAAIEPRELANGTKSQSIIIENDNLYTNYNELSGPKNYNNLSNEEIINKIKEHGIVGLGGACFPTHIKLSPSSDKEIDTIIINGSECEPYLTCDHRLMLENSDDIINGLNILLKLFPKAKAYIGIENNKKDAIDLFISKTSNLDRITIVPLKTKYPQGSEKHLIYATKKHQVPSGKLPSDIGCIVQNVTTLYQIYHSIVNNQPQLEAIITVTGEAIANPKNLRVKLGTSFKEIIEYCGGFKDKPLKVISGGPMMGIAIKNIDTPIVKGTSAILCLDESKKSDEPSQCIRCSKCIDVCPMNLLPVTLSSLSEKNDLEGFEKLHGTDCIECGCCSFTCPAKNNLVEDIRKAKSTVLANRKKSK